MLPNAAEPDQIKAKAQLVNANQAGQAIINPANAGIDMEAPCLLAESLCRFCSNHLPAMIGKPGCIAPAARADVQNKPWRLWQEGQGIGMNLFKAEGLIGCGEFAKAAIVGADCVPGHVK